MFDTMKMLKFIIFFPFDIGVNLCRYGTKKVSVFWFLVGNNILGFGCFKMRGALLREREKL